MYLFARNNCRGMVSELCGKHFSWVHDTFGIHRIFDAPHHINSNVAILRRQQVDLSSANAMLTSASPAQLQRTNGHAVADSLAGLVLLGNIRVKEKVHMEVAITHMTKKRS